MEDGEKNWEKVVREINTHTQTDIPTEREREREREKEWEKSGIERE